MFYVSCEVQFLLFLWGYKSLYTTLGTTLHLLPTKLHSRCHFLDFKAGLCSILFQYALKKIDTSNLTKDYTREATTLCQIRHSNVLAYKTHFKHGSTFCIVMEYCPRGNLKDTIERRQQPFAENEIVSWTIQLCHALQVRIPTCLHYYI